ncbi:MAG TPA: pyridoxal-dependent decarboxylase [Terriglobales bacterium]|nr:pyridoxal-dependent decarboxylase [Terriglobales bacterium]
MGFDFDSETRRRLGYRLIDHIDQYFSSLPDRSVQQVFEQRTFSGLSEKLPEVGEDAGKVLDEICRELVDKGFHVPSANYFGLMNPTPTYMAVLAETLVAALNPQLASLARSQLASKIEHATVRWIAERIGWPRDPQDPAAAAGGGTLPSVGSECPAFAGTFTSGGNEANFTALALALATRFPAAIEDGMASAGVRPTVYASAESHHSLEKSTGLLGIGRKPLRRIAVNERLRMRIDELERAVDLDAQAGYTPLCVVATAGTTNSGAIDDIPALADFCQRRGLWLHVDAAFGGGLVFSDRHRHLLRGIELADSVTIDPHKWLMMPFAAGVIVTRHPESLAQAFQVNTPYMPRVPDAVLADNFRVSAQWSRRMNSLKLWLTLRVHGRHAYEEVFNRQLGLARQFAEWVRTSGDYELALDPELTIVNFRLKQPLPNSSCGQPFPSNAAAHNAIVNEVNRDGRHWISLTTAGGRSVLRMMVISYLTDEHNLQGLQQSLMAAARKIRE